MLTPRLWVPLAILLTVGGCRDAAAPVDQQHVMGPHLSVQGDLVSDSTAYTPVHILQQSPTAPPLETYQVSFWARHNRETTVAVDYQSGQPFIRFHIPKFGLKWTPNGTRLWGGDSVFITLTLDTLNLAVDFQPSGVVFSKVFAPQLVIYYENANPDLNGDGVVDDSDQTLAQQLTIWGNSTNTQGWFKVVSKSDTTQQYVVGDIYHFSQYAICW